MQVLVLDPPLPELLGTPLLAGVLLLRQLVVCRLRLPGEDRHDVAVERDIALKALLSTVGDAVFTGVFPFVM
eukprot:9277191-Pyramimonas_sp.AAC.1